MAKKINWKKLREAYEIQDQQEKEKIAQQKRDEFNSFLTESGDYLQKERMAYDSADFNTFSGARNAFQSGVESWRGRSSAARSYLDSVSSSMDEEEYRSYLDALNHFDSALKAFETDYQSKSNYYSKFSTADEEKQFSETLDLDITSEMEALQKLRKELEAVKTDPNRFDRPSALYQIDLEKRKSAIEDQEKKIEEARDLQYGSKYAGLHPKQIDEILSEENLLSENRPGDDELKWLIDNRDLFEENLTDAEKQKKYEQARLAANRIAMSKGVYSDEYASATKWLNEYEAKKRLERAETVAKDHPVLGSIETVVTSPLNMVGLFEDIGRNLRGVEIDPNSRAHMFQQSNEAIREEISKDLSGFGSFIYNTGMSIADTVVRLPFGSAGILVAGGGAAASQIVDAKKRGASDEQAIASGIASGIAEALFENLSLKGLTEIKNTGGAGLKNFAKSVAKQMWTEGNEELLTEIANGVTDYIINQDLSNFSLNYQKHLNDGYSESEAFMKTALDFGKQAGEAWLGGALSGGVFGLGGATGGAVNNYTVGKGLIEGKQADKTAALASTFDADSLTAKRLSEYEKKATKKGKPSASYTGALYQSMAQESFENLSAERRFAIESTVKTKLEEKGLNADDSTVKAVSKAVFGQIYGTEKMTAKEKKLLADEKYKTAVDELATSQELGEEILSNEKYAAAEEKADQVEEIALMAEESVAIQDRVKRMNVSETGADLRNLRVEQNGTVVTTTGEGKTVPVSESALTEDAAMAVAYSEGMSPAKKAAFFESYAPVADQIPVDEYQQAFDLAYTYGINGLDPKKAVEYAGPVLTEAGAMAAFKKGFDQRGIIKKTADAAIASFRKALGIKREGGTVDDKLIRYKELAPSDPRRAVVAFTKVVAQATGRNFVFFHTTAAEQKSGKENGRYDPDTNTIYIDINAGINETSKVLRDQVLPTVSHELVHIFAVEDPEGFKSLSDLVFAGLKESTGHTRSYLISEEINRILETDEKRFEGKSEETRRAIAEEEIVARACEDRLANSRLAKEFIAEMENKESGLAQKFSNFLGEAIARLKKLFQQIFSTLSRSKEAQSLRKLTDRLEAIQSQYDALLERRATEATTAPSEQQKNTSDRGVMSAEREKKIELVVKKAITQKGKLGEKYNQVQISKFPDDVAEFVKSASKGKINVSEKYIAINGDNIWHEYYRHKNSEIEAARQQLPLTEGSIKEAVMAIYTPDVVESLFTTTQNPTQRQSFAYAKKSKNGHYIVAEAIGGKKNPNVVPVMILQFTENKWDKMMKSGITLGEILYENDREKRNALDVELNKKNRVTVVQHQAKGVATDPRSPQFNNSISDSSPSVNPQNSGADKGTMKADRAKYMTARELLLQAMADEEIKKSEIYSPLLREYANRVTELDKKYLALEAAEHDYVASIDAFDSEEKQAKYKYNMDNLAREISRIERDLTKQEESPELKRLVLREKEATRKQTEKEARKDTASRMSNYRKSIERKSTLERIEAKAKLLSKKLAENTRKSHIPDDLKQPLDKFLGSIKGSIRDLQYAYGTHAEVEFQEATPAAEQSTFVKDTKNALKELRAAIKENSQLPIMETETQETEDSTEETETQETEDSTEKIKGADYSRLLIIDSHILNEMDSLASYLEKLTDDGITYELAELDLDQAKRLDKILTSVSRAINSIDRAFAGQGKEKISDLGESSMAYMKPIIDESKKKGSWNPAKWLKDATTWQEMTPYTAFSQFGEGGRTIYGNILRGWGDYALYAKQILDFAEKTWTPEEAKKWSETVKTYQLADQEFDATTSQIMYLYLVSKRQQGKRHLTGNGFVIGDYTIKKAGVKKTVEAKKVSAIRSTEKQRDAFFDRYLPKGSREREVAETMQRFLADTCGGWGNELSYKLYGYRAFTDPNYIPIIVDPTKLDASAGDFEGGLYRILNMGFTKPLQKKSRKSVCAVDLFEEFATHAADMAKYRSLALPVMDAIRWMNYSPVFEMEDGSVERDPNNMQSVMGAAYGTSAFNYVKQFIMDLNGSNGDKVNSTEKLAASLIRAYKTAAVGANLKVVALQPTSYLRALAVLDRSSLTKAFSYMENEGEKGKADEKKVKKAFDRAKQYSGMALYKSLGYYDVGIGRTLTDQIKQYESLYDKTLDLSMKLAAKADEATLGVLFKACQIQLIDSGKAAGLSREELLKAAGELLDEVIVRTQVVDSTVTRSQLMRSKSKFTKNLTAFMSEPTVAYNLLLQGVFDMQHDLRSGMSFKKALQNNQRVLKKNFAAYTATALAAAAVETLFAALRRREDEDEEEILDGILNGLLENSKTFVGKIIENANPITMIPMIGDLFEKAWNTLTGKKNYSDKMEYEGIEAVWETVASVKKLREEGGFTVKKLFSTIDDGTKAASYLTGLPIANAIREVKTLWNNTLGEWFNLMWDMQAPSASSELEKAFKKGDMRETVNGLINQKYLELQKERPNASSSDLRDRAKSSVKSSATAFFKKRYLDAYKKDDRKKMDEIRTAMRQTGLYDHANQTAFEWEKAYREDRREKGLD